ncbi:hypothetical protein TNCV_4660471 [Trichonephila clavipes]|uniref:Uncharacterized protein n=1 Tax=Trichonephila clavipes TaxID=2585209 RepID=A0A8X6VDQ9_TRICX|nr:hypothetical protein TNCV_4660471 [Trichonephila clavipes]
MLCKTSDAVIEKNQRCLHAYGLQRNLQSCIWLKTVMLNGKNVDCCTSAARQEGTVAGLYSPNMSVK